MRNAKMWVLVFVGVLIVIAASFFLGKGTEPAAEPTSIVKAATKQAVEDAEDSAQAADKAAQSARKAADSTKSTAESAEDSAKDASDAAKDSANVRRPNQPPATTAPAQ